MCFDRDFEWKLDCNAYQIKNVQFGMYIREVFCLQNVANAYQNVKMQFGMYMRGNFG